MLKLNTAQRKGWLRLRVSKPRGPAPMSLLARFRILTKILAIVFLMSGVAATIAYVGSGALKTLNETAERINANAHSSILAARMNVALVAISRAEVKLAADPRPESRAGI